MKKNSCLLMIFSVFSVFIFTSCGTFRRLTFPNHKTYSDVDSANVGFSRQHPRTFTIYPFRNTSWYKEAGPRAREAVFQAFSLIGNCTRLEDTDKRATSPYNGADALRVAREENTDAVVLGEVIAQDRFYLIFLSYVYVRVRLAVYDTRTGKLLWRGDTWSMSSGLGLIGAIVDHYYWSRLTMGLYHRVSMDFVNDLRPDVLSVR